MAIVVGFPLGLCCIVAFANAPFPAFGSFDVSILRRAVAGSPGSMSWRNWSIPVLECIAWRVSLDHSHLSIGGTSQTLCSCDSFSLCDAGKIDVQI